MGSTRAARRSRRHDLLARGEEVRLHLLAAQSWLDRMTQHDFRALTPLIHNHVNPYGSFDLDMEKRLSLDQPAELAIQ